MSKVIINCAITGSIHIPSQSPHLPITPAQIATEAVAAARAGAATVHLHTRHPETGRPITDEGLYAEICSEIHRQSDVVICITTGGGLGMTPEERMVVINRFKPELASLNMGSINFGLFPLLEKYDSFKFEWERAYLESTRDIIFKNTFFDIERILQIMNSVGTKPELECYDTGHLYNSAHFIDKGLIKPPFWFQFIFGIMGGIMPSLENLLHFKNTADKLFGRDYIFSVLAAGKEEFPLGTVGVISGGNIRVGMEDNLYVAKGQLAKSNAELVAKASQIIGLLGFERATPDEARHILELKGREKTSF
jgi:uncharacterized protein (DUF849 family)